MPTPIAPPHTVRLTMAQALVRWLAAQFVDTPQGRERLFGGVFAIFGHGNVAGIGEALYAQRETLPTLRAHNEQSMAHAAIAYAKAHMRRRMMAVTTSIGPGATNLVTAAAVAHVNRLPVLLLPGDVFVSRAPDPVLQQVEDFQDATVSANDCLRPVSRWFDRINAPGQLLAALPRALQVLTDPALCGPVTLALPQDVQTMAFDWPEAFFAPRVVMFRQPAPDPRETAAAAAALRNAQRPVLVAGGGVLYAEAAPALRRFVERHGVPVCETQAGKGAVPWDHPLQLGPAGVTGAAGANALLAQADVVLAVGTRLSDFTTGSAALFPQACVVGLNVQALDATKANALPLVADAQRGLEALSTQLDGWSVSAAYRGQAADQADAWRAVVAHRTARREVALPYDGDVIGAVQRSAPGGVPGSAQGDIVVNAGGTLPAELHKLWRTAAPGGYHMEYGYSCMGYEIAGGLGAKLARPDREVIVMLGDGSYLMLNAEIHTSVMLGCRLVIVVQDNGGYGCINRLQQATGGAPFNNLLRDCVHGPGGVPAVDFAAHARSLGAHGRHLRSIDELEAALREARVADRTSVLVIDTDPATTTDEGGSWWEVAVPEVSSRPAVNRARADYEAAVGQRAAAAAQPGK